MNSFGRACLCLLGLAGVLLLNACGDVTATPTSERIPAVAINTAPISIPTAALATLAATENNARPLATTQPASSTPQAKPAITQVAATTTAIPLTIISTLAPRTTDLKLAEVARSMPVIRPAPDWDNQTWVNSKPLKLADLRGKVVLVEFWTFECINCKNVMPAMHQIYDRFQDKGFTIISFHDPEFSVEKDWDNVKAAVKEDGIIYPVAQDNDFKTWNNYRVNAWPTWFLIDKEGNIRYKHIGEGAYDETNLNIEALLAEPGS